MQVKSIFKALAFVALMVIVPASVLRAADESYIQTLTGKLKKGDSCSVADDKFLKLPLDQWNQIHNIAVDNIVTFELRRDTAFYFSKRYFTCTLNVSIQYFSSRDQLQPTEISNINLVVRYDTATGAPYPVSASHTFKNAYKVLVIVNSITSPELGNKIPNIFIVKNQILIKRKYPFDPNAKASFHVTKTNNPSQGGQANRVAPTLDQAAGTLLISWDPNDFPGAEEYDLEYTFVEKTSKRGVDITSLYTSGSVFTIPASVMEAWMRNDNTRVTLAGQNYTINLPYDDGYILMRIRSVSYQVNTNLRLTGVWQYIDDNDDAACVEIAAHFPDLTWQYTGTFAEEGKRSEVISYFDCSFRSRQTVSINNSDNKAIVGQTVYDAMGRASLNILPTPVIDQATEGSSYPLFDNKLKFYGAVNKNMSNQPYDYTDITLAGVNCHSAAAPLSTDDGAGRYYSSNNPYIDASHPEYADFYFTRYVPDANGHPFSLTEYTSDNTGRIRRQGGVGQALQIGEGQETHHFYGKPLQTELDRLFGVEAGNSSHYLKNMVIDPNGQASVSYVNASGKTVATALAGAAPGNLEALPSSTSGAQWQFNEMLIKPDDFSSDAGLIVKQASATFLAATTGTFQVHYSINPAALLTQHGPAGSLSFCSNCYYKIKVDVKDDCSLPVASASTTAFQLNDYTCHVSPTVFNATLNIPVAKIGEYTVTYTLQLDEAQIKTQTDYYIENNSDLKTLQDFFHEELLKLDLKGCYSDCASCEENLGTRQEFTDKMQALLLKLKEEKYADYPSFDINSTEITEWIDDVYDELSAHCAENCQSSSPCEEKLALMKIDVRPGGQYALYNYDPITQEYSIAEGEEVSVLNQYANNIPAINNLTYENDNGVTVHIKEGGVLMPVSEFIRQYLNHPEWADEFVKYHVEYCSYLWCIATPNPEKNSIEESYAFDDRIRSITKGQTAIDENLFDPDNNIYKLLTQDPFFNNGMGEGYYGDMEDDMDEFSAVIQFNMVNLSGQPLNVKNIQQFIGWMIYCIPADPNASGAAIVSSWTTCNPFMSTDCRSMTAEWELYRNYYLQLKRKYFQLVKMDANPECESCFIGDDGLPDLACAPPGPLGDYTILLDQGDYFVVYKNETQNFPDNYEIKVKYEDAGVVYTTTVVASSSATKVYLFTAVDGDFSDIEILSVNCPNICSTTSSCKDDPRYAYFKGKTRVFDDFTDTEAYLSCMEGGSGPPYPDQPEAESALRLEAVGLLLQEKASWAERLKAVRDEEGFSVTNNQIDLLVEELFLLAKEYIMIAPVNDIRPASSLPPGNNSNGYTNFYEIFAAFVGTELQKGFGPDLLDNPYPHDRAPFVTTPVTNRINTDVCQRVTDLFSYFQTNITPSGTLQEFHDWLKDELGNGYLLTYDQLDDLVNRCSLGCEVLEETVELPIVFATPVPNNPDHPMVTCDRISSLTTEFWLIYPDLSLPQQQRLYEHLYTRFLNFKLGFSLSYSDYTRCDTDPSALIFNAPVYPSVPYDQFSCVANLMAGVFERAGEQYAAYIEIKRREFRDAYVETCLASQGSAKIQGEQYEYHYTLYYYDQSGNLVKTIPPEGVTLLTNPELALVEDNRNNNCLQQNQGALEVNDGASTYNAYALTSVSNTFTMEFWAYPLSDQNTQTQANSGTAGLSGQKYAIFPTQYAAVLNKAGAGVSVGTNGISVYEYADSYMPPLLSWTGTLSGWTHIAVVYIGRKPHLYVNGELVKIGLTSAKATVHPSYNFTGHTYGTMDGRIDEVRIWNVARTEQQINENMYHGVSPTASGLAGYWPMSTTDGSSAQDVTSGAHHAVLVNGNWSWTTNNSPSANPVSQSSTCFIVPKHRLATTYQYNSLSQVVRRTSPDGGSTKFWYDRLGRLVASQNEDQRMPVAGSDPANRYSYTHYDALNRIIEVGEKLDAPFMQESIAKNDVALQTWLASGGSNRDVSVTAYDEAPSWAPVSLTGLQHHLRKRVAATTLLSTGNDPTANRVSASYYSYDITGNVSDLVQENTDQIAKEQIYTPNGTGLKRIRYEYDLVSGKINKVLYQDGMWDQFYYQYIYDANNRIVKALSSRYNYSDANLWIPEAVYRYYMHGPLARTELGINKVQGLDYAYTVQGWLKGVNGICLDPLKDMGGDADPESPWFANHGRDALGFALGYYNGDYVAIGEVSQSARAFKYSYVGPAPMSPETGMSLYNGNISHAMYAIAMLDEGTNTGQTYRYDQLNRLTAMDYHCLNGICDKREWGLGEMIDVYREQISYDANGNIQMYKRVGRGEIGVKDICDNVTGDMDELNYAYNVDGTGRLVNNRLRHVNDPTNPANFDNDIDDQPNDNYAYNNIGNLVIDMAEGIDLINWTVYGKIRDISKPGVSTTIQYSYDAGGNRVSKLLNDGKQKNTYYVRDIQGNVLGVYVWGEEKNAYTWQEQHLYGSSRLGIFTPALDANEDELFYGPCEGGGPPTCPENDPIGNHIEGLRRYELTNHLGNVMVTISDNKVIDGFGYPAPEVITAQDYYVFGMIMPGREYDAGAGYRYGFNGKENDDEVKGKGNQQDYGMRIYDPRIGKFLSVDPLTTDYPWLTPYQFASNMPVWSIDLDGMESVVTPNKNENAAADVDKNSWEEDPGNKAFIESGERAKLRIQWKLANNQEVYKINGVYIFEHDYHDNGATPNQYQFYNTNTQSWQLFTPYVYHYPVPPRNMIKHIFWDPIVEPFNPVDEADVYVSAAIKHNSSKTWKKDQVMLDEAGVQQKLVKETKASTSIIIGGVQAGYTTEDGQGPYADFVTGANSYATIKMGKFEYRAMPLTGMVKMPMDGSMPRYGEYSPQFRVFTDLFTYKKVVKIQGELALGDRLSLGLRAKVETPAQIKVGTFQYNIPYSAEISAGARFKLKWPSIITSLLK